MPGSRLALFDRFSAGFIVVTLKTRMIEMWKWLTRLCHFTPSTCGICSAWIQNEFCTNSKCYYHDHLQGCPVNGDCACPVLDAMVEAEHLERLAHGSS
jgi:uncharacterized protein YcsI (UPF0317 family)